mgnify:CR=1 FL=1|jgi:hypothetical protein
MVIFSFFLPGFTTFVWTFGSVVAERDGIPIGFGVPAFAAAFPGPLVASFGWTASGVLND